MAWRASLPLLAIACAPAPRPAAPGLTVITASTDAAFGTVLATGLDPARLGRLAALPPGDSAWRRTLRVATGDSSLPQLAGRYEVRGDTLRFIPAYRPLGPVVLHVRLDPATAMATATERGAADTVIEHEVALPAATIPAPSTRVLAVYPTAERLPANLLRWYIEFSQPMRDDEAARHLRLLDEAGREVPDAFLRVERELWDGEQRRLTVLFDPGRIKRGLGPHQRLGTPLAPGARYTLRIDSAWRDARGAPLVASFTRTFRATAPDHARPDPRRWRLTPPRAGTRDALVIAFGEPVDHALGEHLIAVVDDRGRRLEGVATLTDADRRWHFAPAVPWPARPLSLTISPELEDVAGNSIQRVFDADLSRDSPQRTAPVSCRFFPGSRTEELTFPTACGMTATP